jgi:hypothetical protein
VEVLQSWEEEEERHQLAEAVVLPSWGEEGEHHQLEEVEELRQLAEAEALRY